MFFFTVVGSLFLSFGLFMMIDHNRFRKRARPVLGRVYGYEEISRMGNVSYHPVIEYVDGTDLYRFRSTIGSNTKDRKIRQKVNVLVVDSDRGEVRLDKGGRLFGSVITIFMGSIFVLIGIIDPFSALLTLILIPLITLLLLKYMKSPAAVNKISSGKHKETTPNKHIKDLNEKDIDRSRVEASQQSSFSADAGYWLVPIGALVLVVGLFWSYSTINLTLNGVTTTGTIIDKKSHHSDGRWTYSPVVSFLTKDAQNIRYEDSTGSSHPRWNVGDIVDIKYDPSHPKDAIIDKGVFNFLAPLAILILGLITLIAGIIQLRKD